MRNPIALRGSIRILSLLALASLAGCETPPVVRTETVEVPVPVVKPLDPHLTADCEPRFYYLQAPITGEVLIDRLTAVELALAICRNQLENIRALQ